MPPSGSDSFDYYGTIAARTHHATPAYYRTSSRGILRRLRPWIPTARTAPWLDLGCGCGELLYGLSGRGFEAIVGVDQDPRSTAIAQHWSSASLHTAPVLEFLGSASDRSYEVVSAMNLLEHLPREETIPFLRECARILRPGGSLILMVPNAVSPFGSLTRYADWTHLTSFTPPTLAEVCAAAAPGQIEFRECGPVPHGVPSFARWCAWQCIRGLIGAYFLIELGSLKGRIYTMDMLARWTPHSDDR